MKIAWHMPTLRRACCGLSIRAVQLAGVLRQHGHDVTFIVAPNKTDVFSNSIDGHPVVLLTVPHLPPMHWSLQALARRRSAAAFLAQLDVDHDVMITCQPEFAAAYGRRFPQRPLVFVCGGTTLLHDRAESALAAEHSWVQRGCFAIDRLLKRRNERAAFRIAHAVVFDSYATRATVLREYRVDRARCLTIHGGVDPQYFKPPTPDERKDARRRLGIRDSEIVYSWTGRISPEKNLGVFFEAISCCQPSPDCVFIVGDGPGRTDLVTRCDRLGLTTIVRMPGEQDDVRPFLHAADAFVFPSRGESFGGSLVEAMACGLPCIALRSDGAGVRNASAEILEHEKTGLLVDRNEPRSLAAAMGRLMADGSLRIALGRAARQRAESCFTWSSAGTKLNELLLELMPRATQESSAPVSRISRIALGQT